MFLLMKVRELQKFIDTKSLILQKFIQTKIDGGHLYVLVYTDKAGNFYSINSKYQEWIYREFNAKGEMTLRKPLNPIAIKRPSKMSEV